MSCISCPSAIDVDITFPLPIDTLYPGREPTVAIFVGQSCSAVQYLAAVFSCEDKECFLSGHSDKGSKKIKVPKRVWRTLAICLFRWILHSFRFPHDDVDSKIYQHFPFDIEESQWESDDTPANAESILDLEEPLLSPEESNAGVIPTHGNTEKQRLTKFVITSLMKGWYPSVAAGVYAAFHTGDLRLLCFVFLFFCILIPRLLRNI